MKICILTPRFPFPENGGDVLRINNIARYFKSQGHQLVLVSFHERNADLDKARSLYDKVYTVKRRTADSVWYSLMFLLQGHPIQCGYYYSEAFRKLFEQVVMTEKPDRYLAHLIRMVPYLLKARVEASSTVEMTDALSKTYSMASKAKGGMLKRCIYRVEKDLIRRYEQFVARRFPKVVLVSQADVDFLKASMPDAPGSLCMYTNGVECMEHPAETYDPDKICFIGNMRTLQNQDAVIHFVNDILPLILESRPNAMFYVVGAEPPKSITSLAEKNSHVVVTGFVDSLEAAVADACIAVAPVQVAAGIQNKVLVAMGMRIPVIMTPLISRAIPELADRKNCLIAGQAETFARGCVSLMEHPALRSQIASAGYDTVRDCYSWNEKLRGY